jgi:hypothetical protein
VTEPIDLLADLPEQVRLLDQHIRERRKEAKTATETERGWIRYWVWGANKRRSRMVAAIEARTRGEHRVYEVDGRTSCCVCTCGARFDVDRDTRSPEALAALPGHNREHEGRPAGSEGTAGDPQSWSRPSLHSDERRK